MDKRGLMIRINSIKNAKRIYRDQGAEFIIDHPESFPILLEMIFENQGKIAIKSSWVFELACLENIDFMTDHLDYFTENLNRIKEESILRPLSKVCYTIVNTCQSGSNHNINKLISQKNKLQIVEANFDWLIEDHKVATQVFAMDTLYLLGLEIDWIHKELKMVLEQNIIKGSSGFQVRGKRVLKKLDI